MKLIRRLEGTRHRRNSVTEADNSADLPERASSRLDARPRLHQGKDRGVQAGLQVRLRKNKNRQTKRDPSRLDALGFAFSVPGTGNGSPKSNIAIKTPSQTPTMLDLELVSNSRLLRSSNALTSRTPFAL